MAACLLLSAACIVLPGKTKLIAVVVVVGAMLVVYPRMLSRALVPRPDRVTLYVDESGVYADDAPYALRGVTPDALRGRRHPRASVSPGPWTAA